MKVLALVLSTIVSTLIVVAGSLVVLLVPHAPDALAITVPLVLTPLIYGAVVLGSVLTYFDPQRSQPSMAAFRRWAIVIGAIDVVALMALFIVVDSVAAPLWIPLSFTGLAIVLLGIAVPVGNALRGYDQRQDHKAPKWSPVSREQIIRKVVGIVVTFVAAFILVFVILLVLAATLGRGGKVGIGTDLVFAFVLAFIASGVACVLVTLPLNRQLRPSLNRDFGLTRKFIRVVLKNKQEALSADERVPAARYASVMAITMPFTLAYVLLLYAGLGIQMIVQVSHFAMGDMFFDIFIGMVVIVLVVLMPMQIVRIRRARRYAHDHEDLLAAEPAAAS